MSNTTAANYPLQKTLGGVTVTVDGVDAPIYFVGPAVINFLIPYAATPGLRSVQIKTPSATLNSTVRLSSAAPAIFVNYTINPPGGAIRNPDAAATMNTPSAPARRGDVVTIYGSGPGALNAQLQDGVGAPSDPLARTVSSPQVFIAGFEVPASSITYSGLTPTVAGLWQINVKVPDLPFITGKVPVVVYMDGVDSNEVPLFVQ